MVSRSALAAIAAVLVGCAGDVDPPWQLDHERIIAVRATPPRIASGDQAVLDALLGFKGAPVAERAPDAAAVVSPAGLAGAVARDGDRWVVTAPDEPALVAARSSLGLPAGAPVPLAVRVSYAGGALVATKTVWLGAAGADPTMPDVMVDGASASTTAAELVVAPLVDIPLSVPLDDASYDVTWLSSCGTMHDFDLPSAYLHVEADDPAEGQLAVVIRDATGGVAWRVWPIRAQTP